MQSISATELQKWLTDSDGHPTLLDVREEWEFGICHIEGSRRVPTSGVSALLHADDRNAPIVVICHHGVRSEQVANMLVQSGFTRVHNLAGGIDAWACEVDPDMSRY